jgi:hypothetical protein
MLRGALAVLLADLVAAGFHFAEGSDSLLGKLQTNVGHGLLPPFLWGDNPYVYTRASGTSQCL